MADWALTGNLTATVNANKPGAQPGRSRKAGLTLGILGLAYSFALMDRHVMSLLLVPMQRDLALTDVQISLIQGFAFSILYSIGSLPIGRFVDHGSRRVVVLLGMAVWSLSTAGCGLARGFWSLGAARLGVGVGEASLTPAAYSMLSDLYPPRRLASAMGTYAMAGSIGVVVAFAVGGALVEALSKIVLTLPVIGVLHPWQTAFFLTGLPGLLLAPLIFLVPEPDRNARAASTAPRLSSLLGFLSAERALLGFHLGAFGLAGLVSYAIFSWTPTYLGRTFDMGSAQIGLALAAILGGGGILSKYIGGRIIDLVLDKGFDDAHFRVSAIALVLAGPFGALAFTASTPVIALLFLALCYLSLAVYIPAAASSLQLITPNQFRGQLSVIYLFVVNGLSLGLGSMTVALLTENVFGDRARVGASLALVVGLVTPLAALMLWMGRGRFGLRMKTLRQG